ncbi:hypothetical protein BN2497_2493 [Janthinobacterium sp. CG23_2]|nr:hypothetical protein BN2497_2493 [Janthinobacterium sp. CG23_2]CUU27644.1 hypothetical protein BN3177_2493 [Janthinobacterium sp. CG23_2]
MHIGYLLNGLPVRTGSNTSESFACCGHRMAAARMRYMFAKIG